MRSEDGGACEKGGGVGMNGGGGAIFCLRLAGGDEWLVGFSGKRGSARFTGSKCRFSGKRGSARFTGSKCRFSPIFLCFYPLRPVVPPPRGARRFDDDETVIARITPRLRDIVLHQAHDPRSQAKHLNSGDNA